MCSDMDNLICLCHSVTSTAIVKYDFQNSCFLPRKGFWRTIYYRNPGPDHLFSRAGSRKIGIPAILGASIYIYIYPSSSQHRGGLIRNIFIYKGSRKNRTTKEKLLFFPIDNITYFNIVVGWQSRSFF